MPALTQVQWAEFQRQHPNDHAIQAISYEELMRNTNGGQVDWQNPPQDKKPEGTVVLLSMPGISPCELAIGYVVFDAVCLTVGAVGLRGGTTRATAEAIAGAAKPVLSKLEITIAKLGAKDASKKDIAKGVFQILGIIYSGGCLGAVLGAFVGSLTPYYAFLYAATAMATVVAALATDGVAFVAEVAILLADFGFLTVDSVSAVETCRKK